MITILLLFIFAKDNFFGTLPMACSKQYDIGELNTLQSAIGLPCYHLCCGKKSWKDMFNCLLPKLF
jgi:hypothetical protein